MATLADLQDRIDLAIESIDALDYVTAGQHVQAGLLMLISIPDTTFDGNDQIRFDRQSALEILKNLQRQVYAASVAAGGSVYGAAEITYVRG